MDRGLVSKEDCELFRPAEPVAGGQTGGAARPREQEAITEEQQQQLQAIKERDRGFDDQIGEIGRGIETLADIANAQNEEVKKHNVMLDNLGKRMDSVHEHVTNVNQKMKNTLDEVARSGDKFCMDALCILLLLGLIAVLYQLMTAEKKR